MRKYKDIDGIEVMAAQMDGKMSLKSKDGMQTPNAGMWLVILPNNAATLWSPEAFEGSFVPVL